MSIRLFRKTWWVDFRHEGQRIRKRSPENSRAGAAHYEAVLRQRLARGEQLTQHQPAPPPRFEAFSRRWYDTYVTTNNKPSEQQSKRLILQNHLVPFFGQLRLDTITALKIEEFKAIKISDRLAPKSVNNFLAVLGKCLRCAEEWSEIERVPRIKRLRVPPQTFDFLTVEEANQLIRAAPDARWRAMITVGLRTGLRLGELLALDWTDVNLDTGILTVRRSAFGKQMVAPKSNRIRHVPLAPEAQRALQATWQLSGLVFSPGRLSPMWRETAHRLIVRTCKTAGIRQIGWHVLRHTFASHLVTAGVSMKAVQELLGHSDIRMTMRYAHLAPSVLHDAVRLLEPAVVSAPILGQPVGNAISIAEPTQTGTPVFTGCS